MKVIALKGDVRDGLGKSATKKVRKEGKVPCVIYGKNENLNFSVYQADFKHLVYTPNTFLVQVSVGGNVKLAKVQELQFHPVSEDIIHADFYEVDDKSPLSISVPVKIVGNSPGVIAGGKLQLKIKKLSVSGLIADLPEFIEVNIDELEIGKSVKVKDIQVDKLQLLDSENNSIVSCVVTRAARSAADGETEEEDATSEEGEATEEKTEE
ncbi:MAG: 50S ribosomal protein L25 [Bacteroidia bacterium]|jgi:large subunit ribosomal protein L25|nr:50S ribosomal protein L25 [Bacteroidia bacterium]MDG2041318.1 50S ribosomal protein L25 [Bacteroidia bacterium]|tara:strand:- start:33 stop:662 length:630 start_codon:yes stop_codon:yes gene_type:complete